MPQPFCNRDLPLANAFVPNAGRQSAAPTVKCGVSSMKNKWIRAAVFLLLVLLLPGLLLGVDRR